MIVVADTTPIVYLARLGRLNVLRALHPRVEVPDAVWFELAEARPDAPGVPAIRAAGWLRVRSLPTGPAPELVDALDLGEAAAITLAESLGADLLLIDERRGRAVAIERGLAVRGTLGLLVEAARRDVLGTTIEVVITELRDEGFRISEALVEQAVRRSRQP